MKDTNCLLTVAICLMGYASSSHAQAVSGSASGDTAPSVNSAQTQAQTETGDIVVTAQKRSERLNDVPVSITAVTSAQLAKQDIRGPADLEKIAPGFTYSASQYGTPVFAIRGIGTYDEAASAQSTVTVYTDQIPIVFARLTEGASLDVERVEVLKGPQGTLFGQNATAGAINYVLAKPTSELKAGVDATYGRFNQADFGGFISGPLTNSLRARLSFRHEYRDDYQESSTRSDTSGRRDFTTGRLLLDWSPTSRLQLELNVNGWRDRSDTQQSQARGYLPVNSAPPLTPATIATATALLAYPYLTVNSNRLADWDPGVSYRRDDWFYQVAGRLDYELADHLHLVALSSYLQSKLRLPIDADGTNVRALFVLQTAQLHSFSQEIRIEGDTGRLRYVVGGNYGHDYSNEVQYTEIHGSNAQIPVSATLVLPFDGDNELNKQVVRTLAVFGNLDFRVTDQLTVQGGVRYNDERRNFEGCLSDRADLPLGLRPIFPGITPGQCITTLPDGTLGLFRDTLKENNVSWRGSLNFKADANTLLYVGATKGYKAGSYGTIPALSYLQFKPVSQESVLQYEGGVKTQLLDRAVDVQAAVFYNDYRDKQTQGQILVPPFGNLPYLINVPKSRVYGAELNLTLKPIRGLRISGGVTYVNSKILGSVQVANPFNTDTVNAGGETLPLSPKFQGVVDAEYDFPVSAAVNAYLGGSTTSRSAAYSTIGSRKGPAGTGDEFKVDGYTLLDLRAGLEFGERYRVQVFGKNVTGKAYWNNVTHIYDTYSRITGFPATYGVSLSARL
ncbi:TonB-dependent receptor [Polymorphobacter sp. PAMC 29334]|uniref:TonB-dependent receptor n=1 Tax=Polymorphobacter sp. PAMC 29334 TaxID=2862331 RepID=UPI001C6856CF|nr:TonB-dependent receptor [Polymorphobacter sp. PAMC 29334]QYE36352.1 TonB-dependent receptor [Polymorphobacter sp. PAMC 29334]